MNEIVNYNNCVNDITLKKFKSKELDLFMAICSKLKDKKEKEIVFTFDELRKLIKFDESLSSLKFYRVLKNVYNKLLACTFGWENETEIVNFVLFTVYKIDKEYKTVKIAVNSEFSWVLNELSKSFTKFELSEFVNLRSSYAKECYRRLKEFRFTGYWIVDINEFRRLLDIPDSYEIKSINQRVLKPILKELSPIFSNFKIEKIKKGRNIVRLKFTFIPEGKNIEYFKTEEEAIINAYKMNKDSKFEIILDVNKGYFAKFS